MATQQDAPKPANPGKYPQADAPAPAASPAAVGPAQNAQPAQPPAKVPAAPGPEAQLAQKQQQLKDADDAATKAKGDADKLRSYVQALQSEIKDIADVTKAYDTAASGLAKRVAAASATLQQKLGVATGGMTGKLKPADIDQMIKASNDQLAKLGDALKAAQAQSAADANVAAQAKVATQQAQATYDALKNQTTQQLAVIKGVEDLLTQGAGAEAQSNYNALYLFVSLAKGALAGISNQPQSTNDFKAALETAGQAILDAKATADASAATATASALAVVAAQKTLDDAKATQRANLAAGLG